MRVLPIGCIVLFLCGSASAFVPVTIDLAGVHPGTIFCTEEEAADIRDRAEKYPWATTVRDKILRNADAMLNRPLEIPLEAGGLSGRYRCEKDDQPLAPHPEGGHHCRRCGTRYQGRQFDLGFIAWQHEFWLNGMERLGWAYTLSEDPRYSERARDILLRYARWGIEDRAKRAARNDERTRTRLLPQSLDEARLLCRLAVGYDRVYGAACFSEDDHAVIAEGLIRPLLDRAFNADHGLSNWQAWHNAAIACGGLILRDAEVIDTAINGPVGFLNQLEEGILESGMWHEPAPLYHFFALRAHIYLLEGMYRSGVDFYRLPVVAGLFNAPTRWPYPDGTLPAINDSDRVPLARYREIYEVGYRRCRRQHYEQLLNPRDSMWSLVWGERTLPANFEQEDFVLRTSNDLSEGLAILRDPGRGIAAYFDYGSGKTSHVHLARLGIVLYAQGDERFVDPGRVSYLHPLYKEWYIHTIAHNAPTVDHRSQHPSAGELMNYYAGEDFSIVRARSNVGFRGVNFRRTLLLADGALFDMVECVSTNEQVFDLPLHIDGEVRDLELTENEEPFGYRHGYELLENSQRFSAPPRGITFATGEGQRMRIRFLTEADETYVMDGIGRTPVERIPMILRRTKAMRTVFASATEMLGPEDLPRKIVFKRKNGHQLEMGAVKLEAGTELYVTRHGKRYRVGIDEVVHVDEKGNEIVPDPLEQARKALRRKNESQLPKNLRGR